jgi:hypothetical protein
VIDPAATGAAGDAAGAAEAELAAVAVAVFAASFAAGLEHPASASTASDTQIVRIRRLPRRDDMSAT